MKTRVARLGLVGVVGMAAWWLSGCLIAADVPGEPYYGPPVVVQEPPVVQWRWGVWPHYEVEHHYVVEHDNVVIQDRHYFPFFGRTRPYIRKEDGPHKGRYKHRD
jgi:hypothetical protein